MTQRPHPRLRQGRDLGLRSRQHALSASPQSVAPGRRAHPRLHRRLSENHPRRGVPAAEGLLPALRHDHARTDGGARARAGRISRNRASDRPLAADAQPSARRGDRRADRPQAHPHQRHARTCRRGDGAGSKSASTSRTCSTSGRPSSSPNRGRKSMSASWPATTSIRTRPRSSRTLPAISKCRMRLA